MRKILFRGKRIDNGEWVFGYYVKDGANKGLIAAPENGSPTVTLYPVDLSTVGQFTGDKELLCDADGNTTAGKKIFDGDILEIVSEEDGNGIYLVFWNDERGGCDWKHLSGAKPSADYVDAIKIIGNRWDNPERIEGSKKNEDRK